MRPSWRGAKSREVRIDVCLRCRVASRGCPRLASLEPVGARRGRATHGTTRDELESRVPKRLRYSVHVLCVSHGRAICRSKPACSKCPLKWKCPTREITPDEVASYGFAEQRGDGVADLLIGPFLDGTKLHEVGERL